MTASEYLATLPPAAAVEADYQNALMAYLSWSLPVHVWRQNAGSVEAKRGGWVQLAPVGAGDITGYVIGSGIHLEIECKMPRRAHTHEQKNWGEMCTSRGAIYVFARYVSGLTLADNVVLATSNIRTAIAARGLRA